MVFFQNSVLGKQTFMFGKDIDFELKQIETISTPLSQRDFSEEDTIASGLKTLPGILYLTDNSMILRTVNSR